MLPLLQWVDRHPAVYAVVVVFALVAVAIATSAVGRNGARRTVLDRWGVPVLLLLLLTAGRWPQLFVIGELNPDASQFIAGALTLRHDPVFWRSVDGMTAGPLIYYTLTVCSWLGLPLTYFSARLVALGLIGVTLMLCHRLIAAHHGARAAALATAPATLLFTLTTDPDFNHYSSELVPIALISLAALLLLHPTRSRHLGWLCGGAFVAGLVPWAKLQAAPIAAALGVLVLVGLARDSGQPPRQRLRRIALVVAAAFLPTAGILAMVLGFHTWEDFYRSYIVQNLLYTEPHQIALLGRDSRFLRADFATLGYLTLILCTVALVTNALARLRSQWSRVSPLLVAGFLMLVIGAGCVVAPGRDFLHYTLLLLPGLLLLTGAAIGETLALGRKGAAPLLCAAAAVCLLFLRVEEPLPSTLGRLAANYRTPDSKLAGIVRLLNAHDRQVGVWGWEMEVYVESGSRQATRSAYTYWQISPGPQRDYFRQRYLGDLQRNRPPVFIDAVGEATKFFQNRSRLGHESFPELRDFIARDYCLVAELRFARVYARRDLLGKEGPTQRQIWQAFRVARGSEYLSAPEYQDLNQLDLPRDTIGRRFVAVMRPPAQVSWKLDGTEREFRFGYGYLPEAELQASGNGTEVTVLIRSPDGTERVLRQFLHNPAQVDAQRGHRQMRLLLPPDLKPGSELRLASGTGPHGDNAWDWLYVTQIGFVRSSSFNPRQFPAFNRPPDRIEAPLSSVDGSYANPELTLHAPARLGFRLEGHERTLKFTYGLKPGAHAAPGRTNGAIFRVTARLSSGETRVVFTRTLQPATRATDRREQKTEIDLPRFEPGTELELEIDPNGSNAWDWTYISSLRLG